MEIDIKTWLTPPKVVAVVGLSDNPDRPSYQVAAYLHRCGFVIVPVNPMIQEVFGLKAYPAISAIPTEISVDIVDIFRRSEEVPTLVQEVIDTGRKPLIWMQEGVVSTAAKQLAETHGLFVVMDQCMMKLHTVYFG